MRGRRIQGDHSLHCPFPWFDRRPAPAAMRVEAEEPDLALEEIDRRFGGCDVALTIRLAGKDRLAGERVGKAVDPPAKGRCALSCHNATISTCSPVPIICEEPPQSWRILRPVRRSRMKKFC